MKNKILLFTEGKISSENFLEIFQGWNAYAKWASSYNLTKKIKSNIKLFNQTN
ncbi:MAG: hypothetical protein WC584_04650 [Candidatus Pacearchaeota archaeon]